MRMLNSYFTSDNQKYEAPNVPINLLNPLFLSFAKHHKLTPRETQVMRILVVEGMRNDDMAAQMHISPKTLKNHLACMMKKTNTYSSRSLQAMFFNYVLRTLLPTA
ncbi:response regulator transcription factor [Cohnella fermenti]|uniref:Helix-turn-helix transcriptional regulator n=1 Tax=Cohnella fermenti TaxID=2565925 RepID=A0A4V6RXL0_9BACL|nr:helix-turn-helix transcriptional regulator [Cohnella fermenti]THF79480.1 helix-turn-helix transcriptional regulator [Cohnella fermenti]